MASADYRVSNDGKLYAADLIPKGPWTDVRAHGALVDGSTDDITAITNAIGTGGKTILIPDGTCLVSTPVILKTGTRLIGMGPNSIIKAATDFGNVSVVRNYTTAPAGDAFRDSGIEVTNIKIDGNKANNSTATEFSACISLTACTDFNVEKVHCLNPKGDGIYVGGTETVKSERGKVIKNTVSGAARQGIVVTEGIDIEISKNHISGGSHHGIDLETNNANSIITEIIVSTNILKANGSGATDCGIVVGDSGLIRDIILSKNQIYNQTGRGIGFRGVTVLKISKNIINVVSVNGIEEITADTSSEVDILENTIYSPTSYGIIVNNSNGHLISKNRVYGAGSIGILWAGAKSVIIGNVCRGGSSYGFYQNGGIHYAKDNVSIDNYFRISEELFNTLPVNDTTPSVKTGYLFRSANTVSTTISMLDDGFRGQEIRILFGDSNTTIDFTGTNLKGDAGVNWSPGTGDFMDAFFDGTNWYCGCHDTV